MLDDVKHTITGSSNMTTVQFKINLQSTLHPKTGTTQIIFDQFVSIVKHHQTIREDENFFETMDRDTIEPVIIPNTSVNRLTRGKLIKQEDWDKLKKTEKDQLDLNENKTMFSPQSKFYTY